MTVIITREGRINVPNTRERDGKQLRNSVSVKASGWVKYRKNGEIHHIPPNQIKKIEEPDPEEKETVSGNTGMESRVTYQSPHGRI